MASAAGREARASAATSKRQPNIYPNCQKLAHIPRRKDCQVFGGNAFPTSAKDHDKVGRLKAAWRCQTTSKIDVNCMLLDLISLQIPAKCIIIDSKCIHMEQKSKQNSKNPVSGRTKTWRRRDEQNAKGMEMQIHVENWCEMHSHRWLRCILWAQIDVKDVFFKTFFFHLALGPEDPPIVIIFTARICG